MKRPKVAAVFQTLSFYLSVFGVFANVFGMFLARNTGSSDRILIHAVCGVFFGFATFSHWSLHKKFTPKKKVSEEP